MADVWELRTFEAPPDAPVDLTRLVERWERTTDQLLLTTPGVGPSAEALAAAFDETTPRTKVALVSLRDFPPSLAQGGHGLKPPSDGDPEAAAFFALIKARRIVLYIGVQESHRWPAGEAFEAGVRMVVCEQALPTSWSAYGSSVFWHRDVNERLGELAALVGDADVSLATSLYGLAADAGNTAAVAEMVIRLEGSDDNTSEEYESRLIEIGDGASLRNLGDRLRSVGRRRRLYEAAVARGDQAAMVALGDLVRGLEPDRARELFDDAAQQGNTSAMRRLIVMLTDRDPERTDTLIQRLRSTGDAREMYLAAKDLVRIGDGRAQDLLSSAALAGDVAAAAEIFSRDDNAILMAQLSAIGPAFLTSIADLLAETDPDRSRALRLRIDTDSATSAQ